MKAKEKEGECSWTCGAYRLLEHCTLTCCIHLVPKTAAARGPATAAPAAPARTTLANITNFARTDLENFVLSSPFTQEPPCKGFLCVVVMGSGFSKKKPASETEVRRVLVGRSESAESLGDEQKESE